MTNTDSYDFLKEMVSGAQKSFYERRTILSFPEYFELMHQHPDIHLRSSAQYLVDMFDYYGTELNKKPTGATNRYKLFDLEFCGGDGKVAGQEEVQENIYRSLSNFAREGRVNKLILLHGPNGSAKSSLVRAMMRASEHYSMQPEGALYSFNWIFPGAKFGKDSIGFGRSDEITPVAKDSYAYLNANEIDARVPCEMHDHPLFLIPQPQRRELLEKLAPQAQIRDDEHGGRALSEYLRNGDLSYKSRRIFDALLASYDGDLSKVLNHVQIERFYLSRRYRSGVATVEPQMAVDARIQQLTQDRSLASLPKEIQHTSLYQPSGPLVDANRGILEFSDFLKRPVESFKYLLSTIETSTVTMDSFVLHIDMVYFASTNETYLEAFKGHPDFSSFKGRMELVKVPYLRHYAAEREIYVQSISEKVVGRHIGPHAIDVAALWAVLTRMRKNKSDEFPKEVQEVVNSLTPLEKVWLYDRGEMPERLTTREAKELKHVLRRLYKQVSGWSLYEGCIGASAREIRTALLNAAYHEKYSYLSPWAVFTELEAILDSKGVYDFVKQEVHEGFHDHRAFLKKVRELFLSWVDDEICDSMGLAEEQSYSDLFSRYVTHITHWVKNEKMVDATSGALIDPDERFMKEIEESLAADGESSEDFRRSIIGTIGARALENPKEKPDYDVIFKSYIRQLREAFFAAKRDELRGINQNFLRYTSDERGQLDAKEISQIEGMLDRLKHRYGYNEESARDAVAFLLREKYKDEAA